MITITFHSIKKSRNLTIIVEKGKSFKFCQKDVEPFGELKILLLGFAILSFFSKESFSTASFSFL